MLLLNGGKETGTLPLPARHLYRLVCAAFMCINPDQRIQPQDPGALFLDQHRISLGFCDPLVDSQQGERGDRLSERFQISFRASPEPAQQRKALNASDHLAGAFR